MACLVEIISPKKYDEMNALGCLIKVRVSKLIYLGVIFIFKFTPQILRVKSHVKLIKSLK